MTQGQITTQQLLTQAITYAMTVSIFASAIGILVAAAGVEAVPAGVVGARATRKGIVGLKEAFGSEIVDKAIKDVGTDDIVVLATRVDELVKADLVGKYGDWATDTALRTCPAGDLRCVREVAEALYSQRATPASPTDKVEKAVSTGKTRAKAKARPIKDKKTGITYASEYATGKALAAEYGFDPTDHFVWYKILKIAPDRFERI